MAKIIEDIVVIKFSKIIKDHDKEDSARIAGKDVEQAIEQVAQELVGDGIVVEVQKV
jgi:hypothetical protein